MYIYTLAGGIPLRISSLAIGSTGTGYVTARSDTLWVGESLYIAIHVRPRRRWGARRYREETGRGAYATW